jgi:hypothetical protein
MIHSLNSDKKKSQIWTTNTLNTSWEKLLMIFYKMWDLLHYRHLIILMIMFAGNSLNLKMPSITYITQRSSSTGSDTWNLSLDNILKVIYSFIWYSIFSAIEIFLLEPSINYPQPNPTQPNPTQPNLSQVNFKL